MDLQSTDRFHAKQGRSTARVRFDSPAGTVSTYLKRHYKTTLTEQLGALVNPSGKHSPAAVEWVHLEQARALGVDAPRVLAVGERIGPGARLQSYLLVGELAGQEAINELLPVLHRETSAYDFEKLKRVLTVHLAEISARLHRNHYFHKDLYLCHFFVDRDPSRIWASRPALIDFHRLAKHRLFVWRWRSKDLGQLLYSTYDVGEINNRDRARFWVHYQRFLGEKLAKLDLRGAQWKAKRYLDHNS